MWFPNTRRQFIRLLTAGLAGVGVGGRAQSNADFRPRRPGGRRREEYVLPPDLDAFARLSVVLGRVTDRSVTVSALPRETGEGFLEYGTEPGNYDQRTPVAKLAAAQPLEVALAGLRADTRYYYRWQRRTPGAAEFTPGEERRFHTQRAAGRSFTFALQGDSHPERPQMSHPELYARTLRQAAADQPDFYLCMGDDFSVAPVREVTAAAVAERYTLQRPFLGLVAHSAPLFLLNGNHEQASRFNYNQTDERHAVAVLAQKARNHYFPTPAPDHFYSGDGHEVPDIGPLKDYCAWTWGDALFVILDNYWQCPVQVDSGFRETDRPGGGGGGGGRGGAPGGRGGGGGGGGGRGGKADRDWWDLTLGEEQYRWFQRTLAGSRAKYKFVFAHHVLGSGRGGVDQADLYEWGGRNRRGEWEFDRRRPGWELPIHQLMVKHGVSIFFQGHDHLFCRQERDGVIYQEVPMPSDHGYATYNEDRYQSGVKLPNSGHLRVTVGPDEASVEYVRSYLPQDETAGRKSGEIAHRYTVKPGGGHA